VELPEIALDLLKDLKKTLKIIDRKFRKPDENPSAEHLLALSRLVNAFSTLAKEYRVSTEEKPKNYYDETFGRDN